MLTILQGAVIEQLRTLPDYESFLRTIQYRLLCTATAAPNDFIEFGTSSEALGELGYIDNQIRTKRKKKR